MPICQSFYFLYYALNRGQNESYKKALLNVAYFVAKYFGNYVTECSFPSNINFKDTEATCVKIATEMKKCSKLKEMSSFNVL